MMVRINTDLPPPEAPTSPRISPLADVERQMVDHHLPAETDHEVMNADRELRGHLLHRYIPIDAKNTANRPSSTITRKIDFTTEVVVCLPSDSRRALHPQAFAAGDDADHQRHERRLDDADLEVGDGNSLMQAGDVDRRAHAAIELRHQPAAIERGHRSDEAQDRQGADQRDHARQDQNLDGIEPHGRQRVDLLAHLH